MAFWVPAKDLKNKVRNTGKLRLEIIVLRSPPATAHAHGYGTILH
jgi:hypothetical protein